MTEAIAAATSSSTLFTEQFPSIASSAKIIGLYFCSSWCPDCIAATPGLVKVIQDSKATNSTSNLIENKLIDVFYISSDRTKEEMENYKPSCMLDIPYEDSAVRTLLKKRYGVCAMKEVSELGMLPSDRKHGIPTLVLINNTTGQVLTENGLSYLSSTTAPETPSSEKILSDWKSLL
jgi:thiol-disulfide isomerase/thioredoxin